MLYTEALPFQTSQLIPLPSGGTNHRPMSESTSPERKLQADIDRLKDPSPYREKFETKEAQQLSQAVDILWRLQGEAYKDASRVGYEKLRDAKLYLDGLLKQHLDREE